MKLIDKIDTNLIRLSRKIDKQVTYKNRIAYWRKQVHENGIVPLTKSQKKRVLDFYKPYKKVTMDFHSFYYAKTGYFDEKYLPDDLYYCYVDPYFNDWEEAHYIDNKTYYRWLFGGVDQPETLGYRINGLWFDEVGQQISIENLRQKLALRSSYFVKKATESEGGHGIYYVNQETQNQFERALKEIEGDIVIQDEMKQHADIAKLNPTSVNTIRVLSLLNESGVKVYSTVLRMGINGAKVDNASSGGITCGIDADGRLKEYAYKSNGERFLEHPTSKVKFDEVMIPNYLDVLELVKRLHPQIPRYRLVSWDIAIRDDGKPILIEANLKYGELDFHQLNNGPIFGEDTVAILDEVFSGGKKY